MAVTKVNVPRFMLMAISRPSLSTMARVRWWSSFTMNRGTFTFVTAIQDETHRFANAYRKQQMKQKSYSSTLTEVPGVGPKTAKALMTQFKSVGAVKEATPDQLENTPGVGRQMAQTIYEYFHPQG